MKYFYVLFVNLLIISLVSLNAQWESDVRLTNDSYYSSTSSNNAKYIATSKDTIHIVWVNNLDGNNEIYYKRSTDAGISWEDNIRLTNNDDNSINPSIAVSDNIVHVVWSDTRDETNEIYYKRSINGGKSWEENIKFTSGEGLANFPSIASVGSNIHIVWHDGRDGNNEIYYKHSTDGGVSWGEDIRLTNTAIKDFSPSIAVSGENVHISWIDISPSYPIYYLHSTDNGLTWGNIYTLNESEGYSEACISADNSDVYVIWHNNYETIKYRHSANHGKSWDPAVQLSENSTNQPSIAVSGTCIHVTWMKGEMYHTNVYYKRSFNAGITWSQEIMLTDENSISSENPSIAVSGNIVHVVWLDKRNGPNEEIYYKRNPTGNVVSVDVVPNTQQICIYPNPADDFIYLDIEKSQKGNLQIFSVLGEKVLETEFQDRMDVSSLPEGIYYALICSGKAIERKQFVIMR